MQLYAATLRIAGQLHDANAAETVICKKRFTLGAAQRLRSLRNPCLRADTDAG